MDSEVFVVEDTDVGVVLGLGELDAPFVDVAAISAVRVAEPSVGDLCHPPGVCNCMHLPSDMV